MKNPDQRMEALIKGQLLRENFNVFFGEINDQGSSLIIRNILEDGTPQYIEVSILSRTKEYDMELSLPCIVDTKANHFYYYILYSPGLGRMWIFRYDELTALKNQNSDDRNSSPYLVDDFSRLKFPELSLAEYQSK